MNSNKTKESEEDKLNQVCENCVEQNCETCRITKRMSEIDQGILTDY